ncbi:MAG: ribonuclease E/G [Oscillospiraceae bacterium]|jgi:Rne/Rng family ribonuclease|nr:ribonuclease E/G [Oscillospiraceae bacterium]
MNRKILITRREEEDILALFEDTALVEIIADTRGDGLCASGNIYLGRVQRYDKSLDSLFVEIGGKKAGILPMPKFVQQYDIPRQGEPILVQVAREGFGTKGARLTRSVTLPGRYVVLTPSEARAKVSHKITDEEVRRRLLSLADKEKPQDAGWILRSGCANASDNDITESARQTLALWKRIQARAETLKPPCLLFKQDSPAMIAARDLSDGLTESVVDNAEVYAECADAFRLFAKELLPTVRLDESDAFIANGIDIEETLKTRVPLVGGSNILIEECETLTAIDVNSGASHADSGNILKVNLLAAREAARQLRLRDIGGVIMIDFIDMDSDEDRQKVTDEFKLASASDRSKIIVDGFTKRGLLELARKTLVRPVREVLRR